MCVRKDYVNEKIPMTPLGIEPSAFRFVAQYLNHCATAVLFVRIYPYYIHLKDSRQWHTYSEVNPEDGSDMFLRNVCSQVKFNTKIKFVLQHNMLFEERKELSLERVQQFPLWDQTDTLNWERRSGNICVRGSNNPWIARVVVLSVSLVSLHPTVWGFS